MTGVGQWLDSLPVAAVGVLLLAAFYLACEFGYSAHQRIEKQRHGDGEASDETQVLSTALLLLALLLGFTFSMALGRYEDRRQQVVHEANDIGTAWLRAGLAKNAAGAALQGKLADYARTRIGHHEEDGGEIISEKARGAVLRHDIWALTEAAVAPAPETAQAAALVSAINAVIDSATTREAAINARVPSKVITLLMLYAVVSCFLLGYTLGAYGSRHRIASFILFLLLSMAITIILDLDRPQDGGIRVSQQAMIELVDDIAPAASK